jgi:hypothetical protein
MRRTPLLIALCAVALTAGAQATRNFDARLAPLPVDVENRLQITGSGSASAVLDGRHLRVSGEFSGLKAPATVAHLHIGAARGVRGGPVLDLAVDKAVAGRFSGEWDLSDAQLGALNDGRLYVQIHSESAPEGNLWGWLLP